MSKSWEIVLVTILLSSIAALMGAGAVEIFMDEKKRKMPTRTIKSLRLRRVRTVPFIVAPNHMPIDSATNAPIHDGHEYYYIIMVRRDKQSTYYFETYGDVIELLKMGGYDELMVTRFRYSVRKGE